MIGGITSDKKEDISKKMRGNSQAEPQEFDIDDLFQFTMKKDWKKILSVFKNKPCAFKAKLTKSEETALHIAVSSYHADRSDVNEHAEIVCQLVDSFPQDQAVEILQAKNDKGDTPLHLAAALGNVHICKCILKHRDLISNRNQKGETPLFLAAHHGKMEAFLLLQTNAGEEPDDSLCRRKDGDTILHSAISGEYFELAYQIISYYPRLVNSVNQEGFSPLHILARKPNVFQSSSNLRLCDRVIYQCVIVHKLKKKKVDPKSYNTSPCCNGGIDYPDNYQTCVNFIHLLWDAFRIIAPLGKDSGSRNQPHSRIDPENPTKKAEEHQDEQLNNRIQEVKNNAGKELKDEELFPPNYATCIVFLKFAMNLLLIMLGIGIWRISKIREKKARHKWAVQIMDELIKQESIYKYGHNGRTPVQNVEPMFAERIEPPLTPPHEHDTHSSLEDNIHGRKSNDKEEKDGSKPDTKTKDVKKETPILLAAKMGITEMVKKILETFPVAIQDLNANEKNALLLAVENRQTKVYDLLMTMKLPEFVLYQVDDKGNSAMHLAAKFQEHQPWRIPGAALQMQWEIKWYKILLHKINMWIKHLVSEINQGGLLMQHVKHSMPAQCFIQYNQKGETAREIFTRTHEKLVKDGSDWLIKTSESCSVVAALIATVAFATSSTIPGGADQKSGHPLLENEPAFTVFSVASIVALCFSVTALVFFLAILTSRCQQQDFRYDLPRKVLFGLSSLFTSIAAILVSFCAAHFFILKDQFHSAAFPIYAVACLPITFFAFAQLPLYFDLLWSILRKVPLRSYKVFYH